MKITRTINGELVEIELTSEERLMTYIEQQDIFDHNDCENGFELAYGEEPWFRDVVSDPLLMNRILDEMALVLRRSLDKYDMSFEAAMDEACFDSAVRELISQRERR